MSISTIQDPLLSDSKVSHNRFQARIQKQQLQTGKVEETAKRVAKVAQTCDTDSGAAVATAVLMIGSACVIL